MRLNYSKKQCKETKLQLYLLPERSWVSKFKGERRYHSRGGLIGARGPLSTVETVLAAWPHTSLKRCCVSLPWSGDSRLTSALTLSFSGLRWDSSFLLEPSKFSMKNEETLGVIEVCLSGALSCIFTTRCTQTVSAYIRFCAVGAFYAMCNKSFSDIQPLCATISSASQIRVQSGNRRVWGASAMEERSACKE